MLPFDDPDALVEALAGAEIDGVKIPTVRVRIGRGVLAGLYDEIRDLWGAEARTALVADAQTRRACEAGLRPAEHAEVIELAPLEGWPHVTAHSELSDQVVERARGCDALVAVGSGTINDHVKNAAEVLGRPYLALATAPSMNGYTSALASLVVDGFKGTVDCSPPVAVLADVDVLAASPGDMSRSGYADLLSKPVSASDWVMETFLIDGVFNELPGNVTARAIEQCIEAAEGIRDMDPEAIAVLFRALILSGFAMTLAGTSSPASGGEHMISHYWDMSAYIEGRQPYALHGLQVALGILLTSRLFEVMRAQDPASFTPRQDDFEALAAVMGKLWPAVRAEAEKQALTPEQAGARVEKIRTRWADLWQALERYLVPHGELRRNLERAGVPLTAAAHGIPDDWVRRAYLHGADTRSRYSVLHLARDTGALARTADEVLEVVGLGSV